MKINARTKISKIIKAHPEAIEAIASVNPHFQKLKNPFLRRFLAPRVTVAEAAKIGGVSPDVLLNQLQAIGFEIEEDIPSASARPAFPSATRTGTPDLRLDVRPDIARGEDPFKKIMAAVKQLDEGQTLLVINRFEPIPLIRLLRQKGFTAAVERPEPGVVHTYLTKRKASGDEDPAGDKPAISSPDQSDFEAVRNRFGDQMKTIDVRHLEMPLPMVTILSELERLPPGHALFVHHKKFPQFLIPELESRGFRLVQHPVDDGYIQLIIYKE